MKKYLVIYHAPAAAMAKMATATPEEKEAGMKPWMEWMGKVGENLLDGGSPLMPGTTINVDGSEAPSTKEVTGYSILQAESMDAAKAMLHGHPHLQWEPGCDVEVHEMISMGG
ncbi:MAG: YciI family protein [Bacteroidota bacterium]